MFSFDDIPRLADEFAEHCKKKHNYNNAGKCKHETISGRLPDGRYMKNLLDDQDYYLHYGEKGYRA